MSFSRFKGFKTKPSPGTFVDWTHPLSKGLVGWWLLNEGAGSRANDLSGNKNAGTITAAAWGGGNFGTTLLTPTSGTREFITVTSSDSLNIGASDSLSMSIWVKTTSFSESPAFINKLEDRSTTKPGYNLRVENAGGANAIECELYDGTLLEDIDYSSSTELTDGKPHHIASVFNRPAGTLIVYIDGVNKASMSGISLGSLSNAQSLIIGEMSATEEIIDGGLDDVRIYKRPLNSFEVYQLFSNPFQNIISPQMRRFSVQDSAVAQRSYRLLTGVGY